jgi:lipoprotein-releasing system permease protein
LRYELLIALRYLRARRKSAFISITTIFTAVGVTIGVAALIITLSVMNGFQASLRERVLSLSPQIQIIKYGGSIANYNEIEAKADAIEQVAGSDPFVVGQAMMSADHRVSGVVVRGIDTGKTAGTAQLRRFITSGDLASLVPHANRAADPPLIGTVAIGRSLADKLKAGLHDRMRMIAPILAAGGGELTTRTGEVEVGAIFDSGVSFIDGSVVFIGLAQAQQFFGREGKVDGVEVKLKNLDDTAAVAERLRRLYPAPYRVRSWIEFNQAASAGFAMLKRVYALVLLMLIGVAAFNLVATLIMVVMEKRKDIAVLMTMGATPRDVRTIFVLKGLVVGGVGTAGGLILGSLGSYLLAHYHFIEIPREIYGISTLPIEVEPLNFVLVALASIALCLAATLYPARQASRQSPVEAIRS